MEIQGITFTIGLLFGLSLVFSSLFRMTRYAFFINLILTVICLGILFKSSQYVIQWAIQLLYIGCPLLLINTVLYVFLHKENENKVIQKLCTTYFSGFYFGKCFVIITNIKMQDFLKHHCYFFDIGIAIIY